MSWTEEKVEKLKELWEIVGTKCRGYDCRCSGGGCFL